MKFGAVVIGRNEGERLTRCLHSLSGVGVVVYVDSGSTDGSPQCALNQGVVVVDLDRDQPFTAARARNAGFFRLQELVPDLCYVQFVDGDCEVAPGWIEHALLFMDANPDVAVVCGRRCERYPERSIYNWLCDRDWDQPFGEVRACGGDAMMRASVLQAVGGYRDDMIAGEEPELCVRVRATGWRVCRLDIEMTSHDADMSQFGQWWRRALRSGYAFAHGAHLHGASLERHWVWESRRAWLWGVWLPAGCLCVALSFPFWGWAVWLIYPFQILRLTLRNSGRLNDRALLAFFQVVSRFPEGCGQIKFMRDRLFSRSARLIEYK